MTSSRLVLVLCVLAPAAAAQTTISSSYPAINAIGSQPVAPNGPVNDGAYNIVTTVGNPLFPAGPVRIGNDGVAIAGATTGNVLSVNGPIPATGFPPGIPPGGAAVFPFWDDLSPSVYLFLPTDIVWGEHSGVLTIEWVYEGQCCPAVNNVVISFRVEVFANPAPGAPWIQYQYSDTDFAIGSPGNSGGSATVGYAAGAGSAGQNVQWSFNTPSVPSGTTLSIFHQMTTVATSPLGAGSLQLNLASGPPNGTYFIAATLSKGGFPGGWFLGIDVTSAELVAEYNTGFPYVGPLSASGAANLGPFTGLPAMTVYAVALGFPPGSPIPTVHGWATSFAIPWTRQRHASRSSNTDSGRSSRSSFRSR
jgi:hypothetical protein